MTDSVIPSPVWIAFNIRVSIAAEGNMSHNPKILITYVRTGGGHLSLSKTIAEYLWQHYPENSQIRMCDFFLESGSSHTDSFLKRSFKDLVRYPRRNIFFHEKILKKYKPITRLWTHARFHSSFEYVYDFLAEEKPEIVLSTHSFTAYVLAKVKKKYKMDFTLISLSPDPFGSSAFIEINRDVDYVIVSSHESEDLLIRDGFPVQQIVHKPFPLNREFDKVVQVGEHVFNDLKLDSNKKTLLISFGGAGVGNVSTVIRNLSQMKVELNVIVVTGWNRGLLDSLNNTYPKNKLGGMNLAFLGFAENMPELISMCDIAFIKPGPSSIYECMIKKRPMILYQYTHHLEKANVDFVTRTGVGFYAGKDVRKFMSSLQYLLEDEHLQQINRIYEQLDIVNGTTEIAEFVYHINDETSVEKELVSN
jgi:processive 1,2-diacylglycerol beta-glucosyltransferase